MQTPTIATAERIGGPEPRPAVPAELLDVRAVAALLGGCSTRHVYRLTDAGRMPRPVKLGALVRWRRAELSDWLSAGCPPVRTAKGGGDAMTAATLTRDAAEGARRKLSAHSLLAARRELYVLRGRRALLAALLDRGEATADDVRRAVALPDGIDPVCLGTVPGELARAGIIARIGFATTARPEAHARPVSVWRLADRAAALAWLAAHPDRPDPAERGAGGPEQTLFE